MTDQNNHNANNSPFGSPSPSYVDSYQPPKPTAATTAPVQDQVPAVPDPIFPSSSVVSAPAPTNVSPFGASSPLDQQPATVSPNSINQPQTAPSDSAGPVLDLSDSNDTLTDKPKSVGESLEDQNIFFLLGVDDGSDEEKEEFLTELQQVIWEDFLDSDVELLITEEEKVELDKIKQTKDISEDELQEKILGYLEKLVPDLEEILLEKALELKEEMVRERLAGMREYYAQDQAALDKLDEAEKLMDDDQWRVAAEILNSIE